MFLPWVSVLALLPILGANRGSVTQPDDRVTVSQGEPVLLKCTYDNTPIPTLWWYEQYPSEAPRLLLTQYEASDEEGLAQSDSVDQSPPEVRISEGQSVTLHCNFTTSGINPYLFWYRQYPNQPPQHILTKAKFDAPDQTLVLGKFSASLHLGNKTVPFKIEAVSQQESAVYYCALRPTVRENCISTRTKSQR
ncbi:T cell receptor alpha variable 9D-4, partial [Chelydra serpentina]